MAFAEAVYAGEITIENVAAHRVETPQAALEAVRAGIVPVLVDPGFEIRAVLQPLVIVDGRMTKKPPDLEEDLAGLVVGLGPGFIAGENCHAVIETKRGADLGRVIWRGGAEADTGLPDPVWEYQSERVLRAPGVGSLEAFASIGDRLQAGQVVAAVNGQPVRAAFAGVLRGLLRNGTPVWRGLKIGDVDPRNDPRLCSLVSDKALAVGGGVLEAILVRPEIRSRLWDPPI